MTEQETETVRYTLDGVELTARKDENGYLLIARADKEPSRNNPAVAIRPNPRAREWTTSGSAGKWWFKLFEHPGSRDRAFDTADTLEKAVAKAEAKFLNAARREAAAILASVSVEEAGEILDNQIDLWLERKCSEGSGEG